jgi:pullulanase/glycogen debranching enzyme
MGFLMRADVERAFNEVKKVDPDTWFYAEGWDFGETANNARGVNGTQWNMAGSGFGSYNDRLRDAVRGANSDPMNDVPGYANAGDRFDAAMNAKMDLVRLGMTGSLQDYPLPTASGSTVLGRTTISGGKGAGYSHGSAGVGQLCLQT